MKNIVLIGFMGTGKTSTGRLLASRLGRLFIDIDLKIEQEENMTVQEIFECYGEEVFRQKERSVIVKLSRLSNTVIATGGGAVLYPPNRIRLRQNGVIICLSASVEAIVERTAWRDYRPLLNCENPEDKIVRLLAERQEAYSDADLTIDTSIISPQLVTEQIIDFLRQGGLLHG
jgi:shikimate kinase